MPQGMARTAEEPVYQRPAWTCLTGALFGSRRRLPSKRTRTARRPRRVLSRVRNVTLLRYVQSGRSPTCREEIPKGPPRPEIFLKRTVTRPLQRIDFGGGTQYTGPGPAKLQIVGTQVPPASAGTTPAAHAGGGTTRPVVTNLYGRVRSTFGVVDDVTFWVAARTTGLWPLAHVVAKNTAESASDVTTRIRFTATPLQVCGHTQHEHTMARGARNHT